MASLLCIRISCIYNGCYSPNAHYISVPPRAGGPPVSRRTYWKALAMEKIVIIKIIDLAQAFVPVRFQWYPRPSGVRHASGAQSNTVGPCPVNGLKSRIGLNSSKLGSAGPGVLAEGEITEEQQEHRTEDGANIIESSSKSKPVYSARLEHKGGRFYFTS